MKDTKGTASSSNLYACCRANARKRGYSFELSKERFLELCKMGCYYCGIAPSNLHKANLGKKSDGEHYVSYFTYNGVDRYDNALGYNENNCVAACFNCNRAKGERSPEEFKAWILRVLEYFVAG